MPAPDPDLDLLQALDRRERRAEWRLALIAALGGLVLAAVFYGGCIGGLHCTREAASDGAGLVFVAGAVLLFLTLGRWGVRLR